MSTEAPTATVRPDGKLNAAFFAAVRERGMMNAMLEIPAKEFEALNPNMRCRWEYSPKDGDQTLVIAREAMGFRLVDAGELSGTESSQTSGPIRRGDLILMCGPRELVEAILAEDARAAEDDAKMPERAYRESLESTKTRRRDGVEDQAKPTGKVTKSVQVIRSTTGNEEGGE